MTNNCFCHFQGFAVKDATARNQINQILSGEAKICFRTEWIGSIVDNTLIDLHTLTESGFYCGVSPNNANDKERLHFPPDMPQCYFIVEVINYASLDNADYSFFKIHGITPSTHSSKGKPFIYMCTKYSDTTVNPTVIKFSEWTQLIDNNIIDNKIKPYELTNDDKNSIISSIIEELGGNPIFGVDEDNNIIISGDLEEGVYTVKYEMDNGTSINIGKLTIGEIINQITHSIDSTGNPFNNGTGYKTGARLSLSSGAEMNTDGYECSGFIQCKKGDIIRIKNIDISNESATNIVCYDINKQPIKVNGEQHGTTLYTLFSEYGTESNNVYTSALNRIEFLNFPVDVEYIRIGSKSITSDSILTINQEIM